ncbi:hypothetical protein NLJ89_g8298 [Agrocybe chaxingu]|uniref:F-box domain-containing protein n=1 Tax=Agrocybe chaxingu TaxID=84603 RepID=A0A9W8JXQ4_9AGAR|nr:hypothetical protein NLJ89_g8298 [Agrocybe chaxingu]
MLTSLPEDALVYVLSFLEPPDILPLCSTCKRLYELGNLRIVWTNASQFHVIARGYPFPSIDISSYDVRDLRRKTLSAYSLAHRWLAGLSSPRRKSYISGTSGTSVSHVRFLPGHGDRFLLTIAKSIWSAVAIWDLSSKESRKVGEWSPRGAIFNGFALNEDPDGGAELAISVHLNGEASVRLLSLDEGIDGPCTFREIYTVSTTMRPLKLVGYLLALSDETSQTAVWNWRNGTYAILENSIEDVPVGQSAYNECIQVLFAHRSILVVRARSVHLFPYPTLKPYYPDDPHPTPYTPIAHHSFGWVDGMCVNVCPYLDRGTTTVSSWSPLSILVRGESDDPWTSDVLNLELYTIDPNADYPSDDGDLDTHIPPYLFPPRLVNQVRSLRGSLRCTQVFLGRFGTAAWIQPQERFYAGLLADVPQQMQVDRRGRTPHESLMMAVFPGSLSTAEGEVVARRVFVNEANNWTSFDYDEVRGRVALGSSFGVITLLEL